MLTLLIASTISTLLTTQPREGPKRLDPASSPADIKPHTVYSWTSGVALLTDKGKPTGDHLRYTYVLPEPPSADSPRDLVVICHGTGLDYRWGSANHDARTFRPDDIVVSVDGPTKADNDTRLFLGRTQDARAVDEFLTEMKRTFPVRRVYLYGHSQGSFFVSYFSGLYPEAISGVVAHASGVWSWTDTHAISTATLPIVFMHGSADPVVPYGQSAGARDWFRKLDPPHPFARLRRLDHYNHWPNQVRTSECIDYLKGMSTADPAEALAAAKRMTAIKPPDIYQYTAAPAYSLAIDLLRRINGEGVNALENADPDIVAHASNLRADIEAIGAAHVESLRKAGENGLRWRDDLKLDAHNDYLGHLLAVREDFRNVKAVEAFLREIKFDETAAQHDAAAKPLREAWYGDQPPAKILAAAVEALPNCFLCDTLPANLGEQLTEWYNTADTLKIGEKTLVKATIIQTYTQALKRGRETYNKLLKPPSP